MLICWFIW